MKRNRRSICLKIYDYSSNGMYFVTICSKDRIDLFGQIQKEKMVLNDRGMIVKQCWQAISMHFENVGLDEFIVMPTHVHRIIFIRRGAACRAPTSEQFGKPKAGSLPTIIWSFKSAVIKQINLINNTPGKPLWQRNYYDHVIRDEYDLKRIRQYIINNPQKWKMDEYFK